MNAGKAIGTTSETSETSAMRRRARILIVLALICLLMVALLSLTLGRFPVAVTSIPPILRDMIAGNAPADDPAGRWTETSAIVIRTVRLPRVTTALMAGAGLGLTGAAVQGLLRNPLAGPHALGISNGAAVGGVIAILLGVGAAPTIVIAFASAIVALALVFLLDRAAGAASTLTIVLAGIVISAFCGALVGLAEYFADPERQLPGIVYWLLGSFATTTARSAIVITIPTVMAGALLLALRWRLNILSLGEDDARALGTHVTALRWMILSLVTLIVAAQVSVSGAIGWVGLVVPHFARRLVGPDHRVLLPASACLGALYLLVVDDIARTLTAQEIPIGILTALLGTPIFAVILWRYRTAGWSRG